MSPAGARLVTRSAGPVLAFLFRTRQRLRVHIPDTQPAKNLLPAVESCAMLDIAKARKQLAAEKELLNKAEELLMLGKWVEADEVLSEYNRMRAEQPYMKQDN